MSSEKHEGKKEYEFYEKIKTLLEGVFAVNYITERAYMGSPFYEENPHLEITAYGQFSPTLKNAFSKDTLRFFRIEKVKPDIMGFVKKKLKSPKELITVEVKRSPIELCWILKAKFYQDFFGAKWSLLISPKGIVEDKVRFVVDTDFGRKIRGKVIIAKYNEPSHDMTKKILEINPRFKNSIPEPFKRFVKP